MQDKHWSNFIDGTLGQINYRSNVITPEFTVWNESMVFEITQLPLMSEAILSTASLTAAPAAAANQLQLVCCLECNPHAARSPTSWCGEKVKSCWWKGWHHLKSKTIFTWSIMCHCNHKLYLKIRRIWNLKQNGCGVKGERNEQPSWGSRNGQVLVLIYFYESKSETGFK